MNVGYATEGTTLGRRNAAAADLWILDRFETTFETEMLIREVARRGWRAEIVDWDTLTPSCVPPGALREDGRWEVPRVGVVRSRLLTRNPAGGLPGLYSGLGLLEDAGVRLVNTVDSLIKYENKIRQVAALAAASLPVPATRAARTVEEVDSFLTEHGDIVVKPPYGHAAIDVVRLRPGGHGAKARSSLGIRESIVIWHLLDRYGMLCVQQFVRNSGRELRVQVVGQRIVSTFFRASTAPDGSILHPRYPYDFVKATLTSEDEKIILSSVATLGLDVASLDLVEGPSGLVIIEVNPSVETWATIESTPHDRTPSGITHEFADLLCDFLEAQ